jgi:hypothetical protein
MLNCLDRIRSSACLEHLDWVPVVSTATNIVHLFAKYAFKVQAGTNYGNYLHKKTISEDLGLLVPLYNIYVKSKAYQGYRLIPQKVVEMTSIGYTQDRRFPITKAIEAGASGQRSSLSYHSYPSIIRFIEDAEISTKATYIQESEDGIRVTCFRKAIIQQNSHLSAFSACLQMLIVDLDFATKRESISKNITTIDESLSEMTRLGFKGKLSIIPSSIQKQPALFMETLKHYLFLKGSLIIGVDCEDIGAHFIIVDSVSDCLKYLRIRDPYHGWEITVQRKALIKRLRNKLIQIG